MDTPKTLYPEHTFPSDATLDEDVYLEDYWKIIKSHKWGILGLAFTVTIIGVLTAFSLQPTYIAHVTMLIEPEQPKIISFDPLQNSTNVSLFYQTQYEIIKSRTVADKVIKKLALEKSPELLEKKINKIVFPINLEAWIPREWRFMKWWTAKKEKKSENELYADLTLEFKKRLNLIGMEDSQIVKVGFEASDPVLASQIANAIADAYAEMGLESRLAEAKHATSWLTERLANLRGQLARSEEVLQKYQEREGVVGSKSQQSIISGKLAGITQELVKAQTKRVEAEILYNQVQEADQGGRKYDSLRIVLGNPLIQKLKEEESRLSRYVVELSGRYGLKHPKIIAAKSDLSEATKHLQAEAEKLVESIRNQYKASVESEKKLLRLSERMKSNVRALGAKKFQMAKLEREVAANRQLYDIFLTRFKETDISGENNVTNVRIIDRAQPPIKPSKPRKKMIVVGSTFIGLFLGVMFAFIREHLDKTFKTTDDVERVLKLPVLGATYYLKKGKGKDSVPEYQTIKAPKSPFAEAINNIRTGVLFANLDSPPKTILVTSAVPGEGKTTLSCNLAASLSKLGKTLLIDADLRKPGLARVFHLNNRSGLTNLVAGKHTTLRKMKLPLKNASYKLYVLSSGVLPINPLEFLSSKRFSVALANIKKHFDFVVIDAAPVLPYSDSIALAHLVDEVIFVIKAEETTHDVTQDAIKRLVASNIEPLGAVLSHMNLQHAVGYGRYYGYYDDGDGKPAH